MITIMSAWTFLFAIYHCQFTSNMEDTQWDLLTATVADFTVQLTLTSDMWREF